MGQEGCETELPYLRINGIKTYYSGDKEKAGVPVLFCHGSGGGHHHWHYQCKNMPLSVNPFAVDLPGHGRSEGKAFDDINMYREWVRSFSKNLGLENYILAGHSMGGAIALAYALKYPDALSGLILVSTGARLRVLPAILEKLQERKIPDIMLKHLYAPGAPKQLIDLGRREITTLDPSVCLADFRACNNFDIIENLFRIKTPSLIVCGDQDNMTPVKYSLFLKEKLQQSRLEIIEEAGHMVMLEKPQAVNRAIANFIEEDLI